MKIHPIIFNWKKQHPKTLAKHAQFIQDRFRPESIDVINSDDQVKLKEWHNIGEQSYYTAQFKKATELWTENDILFLIQGDVTLPENWDHFLPTAMWDLGKLNWGVYAPNVNYTAWNSKRTDVQIINTSLARVACTDCSAWMIHPDIMKQFLYLKLDLSNHNFGFGIDMIMCGISHMMNRPVIRNYDFTFDHPKGTNYNGIRAYSEFLQLNKQLPKDLQEVVGHIYRNPKALVDLQK